MGFKEGPRLFGRSHDKPKDKKRDEYTPAQAGPSGTNQGAKGKKPKSAMKSDKSSGDQEKKKVHFSNYEEAHEGIEKELIGERKKEKRCTRCAFEGHTWKECWRKYPIRKGVKNSKETGDAARAAKAAGVKRKAEAAEKSEDSPAHKKAAGIRAAQSSRDDLGGVIFEEDSDQEMRDF